MKPLCYIKKSVKLSPYKLQKLAKEVFERDNYTCQIPGCNSQPGYNIAAGPHHIIPRARLRLDIKENLLTVCITCHTYLHCNLLDVSVDDLIDKYNLREYLK